MLGAMEPMGSVIPRLPPARIAEKKRISRHVIVALVLGGAAGFLGASFGVEVIAPLPGSKWLDLLLLLVLPLTWLLAVAVHEAGHLVGGWLTGGRFLLWVVGPFMVRRTPSGVHAAWNRNVNLAGGMAACLPLDPKLMTPPRAALMILGGPAASLVLTHVSLFGAVLLNQVSRPDSVGLALAYNVAVFTAGLSLLIFLATVWPATAGGFKSDGRRFIDLLRGDARSEQEAALLVLTTAGLTGIRPADYDPALVAKTVSLNDGSLFDLYGHLTVYYHAADRAQWSAAQAHLDHVMTGATELVPFLRDTTACEYAWLIARQTGEAGTARAWLDTAGKLDFDPATRLRAESAVLLAEGCASEAAAKAREGLHALEHRSLTPVKSPFAEAALNELLQKADAATRPLA